MHPTLIGLKPSLACDQFARMFTRSLTWREENVVSSIRWPSFKVKSRKTNLTFLGYFQKKLHEEDWRRETLAKSDFRGIR